jgi:hypothetical protein
MEKRQLDIAYMEYQDNILYVRVKNGLVLETEHMKMLLERAIEMAGGEKYYALIDTSDSGDSSPEARTYYAECEFTKYRYADAYVVDSLATRLLVNFYMKFNKPKVKSKMFGTISEAKQWLE